jgi:hypothetical protein
MEQILAAVRFTQRTPAGLPSGMPGRGEDIEMAMQQAPQPDRQVMVLFLGRAIGFIENSLSQVDERFTNKNFIYFFKLHKDNKIRML